MKKILLLFLGITFFTFSSEHLTFFIGQDLSTIVFEDESEIDLKSSYSFGGHLSVDLGQNFEFGVAADIISLSQFGDIDLKASDKLIPAYFRLDAKATDNGTFVPYFFATYGKLITDLQCSDGTSTIIAKDGICKSFGVGVKFQDSFKIEIYDETLENDYEITTGMLKKTQSATTNVMGVKLVYILR